MPDHRETIRARRLAFLSSALALAGGCNKPTPTNTTPTTDVTVGGVGTGTHTVTPTTSPASSAKPPGLEARPSLAIPKTDCEGDRQKLESLRRTYQSIHEQLESLNAALPASCKVTDDACLPEYQPLAKRFKQAQEQLHDLHGMCSCPAPIVEEYMGRMDPEVTGRLKQIRDRIGEMTKSPDEAGEKWDEMVRSEATPRPCLSCVRCEPKSACDPP